MAEGAAESIAGVYVVIMIIVSGWLRLEPANREQYLDECRPVIEAARRAPGCLDFHLSADPLEDDRINVFEKWDNPESVERFRCEGPSDSQQAVIVEAQVDQHEIVYITSLT